MGHPDCMNEVLMPHLFQGFWIDRQPSWLTDNGTSTELDLLWKNILATGEEEQENQRIPVLSSVKEERATASRLHTL